MRVRNAAVNHAVDPVTGLLVLPHQPDGTIDCEILIEGNWLPFRADPSDPEPHGAAIHAALQSAMPFTGELEVDW